MKILQKVTVKQVLTECSKRALLDSFETSILILNKECEQFRFEMKKVEKNNKYPRHDILAHFNKEIENRNERIKLLDFQIEQLNILPLGSELKEKEVDAIIDVEIGNSWDKTKTSKSIIIRDGIVVDIR
jgi:hypothetical protein